MGKRILVVDDEPDIVKFLSLRLKGEGHEVLVAHDGQAALDILKESKPDLIVLDVKLPKIDGCEVCRQVRKNPALTNIPVVFATADASLRIDERCRELKANDYILKPFAPEELFSKIQKYLS